MSAEVLEALEIFKPRALCAWMLSDEVYRQRLQWQITAFPSYALPSSKRPTLLTGLVHEFGVGTIWMLTGVGFERDIRVNLPMVRVLLKHLYEELNLRRLQIFLESGRKDGAVWAKHTGFVRECGPLKSLGVHGEDADIWIYQPEVC